MKSFEEVLERFRAIEIKEDFDIVVAIASGGIVPAALLNQRLQKEFNILEINFRDEDNVPRKQTPELLRSPNFDFQGRKVLLVDDRIKSGKTIDLAKKILEKAALVKTFAVNGSADYFLYNEDCFKMPWKF